MEVGAATLKIFPMLESALVIASLSGKNCAKLRKNWEHVNCAEVKTTFAPTQIQVGPLATVNLTTRIFARELELALVVADGAIQQTIVRRRGINLAIVCS